MTTTFVLGDRVRINRHRCGDRSGAVWEVDGISRDTGEVSIRSPGRFVVEVAARLLAPAPAEGEGAAPIPADPPDVIPMPAVRSFQREFDFGHLAEQIA